MDGRTQDVEIIAQRMEACLRELDRINARLAAVHLETAIRHLRVEFDLDPESSEMD